MSKQDVKAISIVLPFRQNFMTLLDFPETLSRVTLALLSSVFQTNLSDIRQFSNLLVIGIMIKQKTVSAIISDTWKTHKQVCAGKLPDGENRNMGKH